MERRDFNLEDFTNASICLDSVKKESGCSMRAYRNKTELDAGKPIISQKLKRQEHWRLYDSSKKTLCLDIETNGLQPNSGGYVTLWVFTTAMITSPCRGENLSAENLKKRTAAI
jgi:hypothetical protein